MQINQIPAEAKLNGFLLTEKLFSSEKVSVHSGVDTFNNEIVYKKLVSKEPMWVEKFQKEVLIYGLFKKLAPDFARPKTYFLSEDIIVIEYLKGDHLSTHRYPDVKVSAEYIREAIATLKKISEWNPDESKIFNKFEYSEKLKKYSESGYLNSDALSFVYDVLTTYKNNYEINHGDALLSNVIFDKKTKSARFFDWEFMDFYLPAYDLAMLHTTVSDNPAAIEVIERDVKENNLLVPFYANKLLLLAREIRMHDMVPDHLDFKFRILKMLKADYKRLREAVFEGQAV